MKSESLVIADQNAAVNTFPGLVHTARHTMGVCCTRSRQSNRKEDAYHGVADDWGEVVTRQPQGNLRLDHLLNERLTIGKNPQQVVLHDDVSEGLQLSWLEHTLDKRGVTSSSLVRPTTTDEVRKIRNIDLLISWGLSLVGRAPALHAGGQEFDSPSLHHTSQSDV